MKSSTTRPIRNLRVGAQTIEHAVKSDPNEIKAAPERALPSAITELSMALSSVEANQSNLYDRLRRVLEPVKAGDGSVEEGIPSLIEPPLVEVIDNITRRVYAICGRQRDILDRLQV